jgi:hypothetical protein
MSDNENEQKISGDCIFLIPNIEWPQNGTTIIPPRGSLIDTMFKDWHEGELRDSIRKQIEKMDPWGGKERWDFCREFCSNCQDYLNQPGKDYFLCRRRGHPPFINNLMQRFRIWPSLLPRQRRAIILLTLFGDKGMRPGGYRQIDIARIAGVNRQRGLDLTNYLERRGFLKNLNPRSRKKSRYAWVIRSDILGGEPDILLQSNWDSTIRMKVKETIADLSEVSSYRKEFRQDCEYSFLMTSDDVWHEGLRRKGDIAGIIVGKAPPKWLSTHLEESLSEISNHLKTLNEEERKEWNRFIGLTQLKGGNSKIDRTHCSILISDMTEMGDVYAEVTWGWSESNRRLKRK